MVKQQGPMAQLKENTILDKRQKYWKLDAKD